MPKEVHDRLVRQVNREHPGWSQKRKDAYVYSTLNKIDKAKKRKRKK
jgi:hypothetical protein